MAQKTKIIKQLLETAQELQTSVSTEDFKRAFKIVTNAVKLLKEKTDRELTNLRTEQRRTLAELERTKNGNVEIARKMFEDAFAQLQQSQRATDVRINERLSAIRDGYDGKDADDAKITDDVIRELAPAIGAAKDTVMKEVDELYKTIDKLENQVEALAKQPRGSGGGGTSALGVRFALGKMMKTETPSGAINGTNKAYTVTQDIHHIFSFGINGQVIHSSEYSVSGRTITFTTAIPAAFASKSFEIVYA